MRAIQRIFIDKAASATQIVDTVNTALRNIYDSFLDPAKLITNFEGNRLGEIADPVGTRDAATKGYVDRAVKTIKLPKSTTISQVDNLTTSFSQPVAAGTNYGSVWQGAVVNAANEARIGWRAMLAMTVGTMIVLTADAQPGTGTMVITLQVNDADSSLAATVGSGAAAGTFTGAAAVNIAAGDVVRFKIVNNAGSNSAIIKYIGVG